jgi:hypothetical protein
MARPAVFQEDDRGAGGTYSGLKPHYDTVARVLNLQTVPDGQLTERLKLTREAAEKLGHRHRFSKASLAVSFSQDWHYGLDDPFDRRHSRSFVNAQGQQQGTCIHLGHCDIGCEVRAKNGLDLTYLALAEKHGCEVWTARSCLSPSAATRHTRLPRSQSTLLHMSCERRYLCDRSGSSPRADYHVGFVQQLYGDFATMATLNCSGSGPASA